MQARIIFLVMTALAPSVHGIVCHKCQSIHVATSGLLSGIPQPGPSDPSCSSVTYSTKSKTCPDYDSKCVYINATANVKLFIGNVRYTVEVRDCIENSFVSSQSTGCHDDITGPAASIVNQLLSFSSFSALSLSGKSCYCSESYCDAKNPCNGLFLLDTCWELWMVILIGIALAIAALLILTGCCCCCCCACCKDNKPHPVQANPQVFVVPNQQLGMTNPGFHHDIQNFQATGPGYNQHAGAPAQGYPQPTGAPAQGYPQPYSAPNQGNPQFNNAPTQGFPQSTSQPYDGVSQANSSVPPAAPTYSEKGPSAPQQD